MTLRPVAYLHAFKPLTVGGALAQPAVVAWLKRALTRTRRERLGPQDRRALALYDRLGRSGAVESRVSALADYARHDWRRMTLFRPAADIPWFRPALQARMAVYEETVLRLARRAFPAGGRAPDYAIQISCTGYASPHAVQRVLARRGPRARILHLGHMGCYASIPAAAMAAELVRGAAAAGRPRARAPRCSSRNCARFT